MFFFSEIIMERSAFDSHAYTTLAMFLSLYFNSAFTTNNYILFDFCCTFVYCVDRPKKIIEIYGRKKIV